MFSGLPRYLNYGEPINRGNPLNRGLLAWFKPLAQNKFARKFVDLNRKGSGAFAGSAAWAGFTPPCGMGGSVRHAATGDYFTGTISIASGSNLSFSMWLHPTSWAGTNPGIWRQSTPSHHWNIFQGSTGLPWIYWDGSQVLAPISGYAVPLNAWNYIAFEVVSSSTASFYANGIQVHTASHAQATQAFTLANIGYQLSTAESVLGYYGDIRISTQTGTAYQMSQYKAAIDGFRSQLNWYSRTAMMDAAAVAGRTTRNTRSHPLGFRSGVGFSVGGM